MHFFFLVQPPQQIVRGDGRPAWRVSHTLACRTKIEAAMRSDGDERLRRADERRDDELARRLASAEGRPTGI